MRVLIVKGYIDKSLNRKVSVDEELIVTESRGKRLIDSGVAKHMPDDVEELSGQVKSLQSELARKESEIDRLNRKVASLEKKLEEKPEK